MTEQTAGRFIPIGEWAAKHYKPAPTAWVLAKWARRGEIDPPPQKVGTGWAVQENAKRIPKRKRGKK